MGKRCHVPALGKAFDTVPQDILVSELESRGLDRWTTWWIRNCLVTLRFAVDVLMSKLKVVTSNVTQRSVLGPVLFKIFIGDTASGINMHPKIQLYNKNFITILKQSNKSQKYPLS